MAALLPVDLLRAEGVEVSMRRVDAGLSWHGDHVGSDLDGDQALMARAVDAACMIDANHRTLTGDAILPGGATRSSPGPSCSTTAS